MAARKAASVFPEPVGARRRVWLPAAMGGQPSSWAPVGATKLVSNHARVGGEKRSRTVPAIADHATAEVRRSTLRGQVCDQ